MLLTFWDDSGKKFEEEAPDEMYQAVWTAAAGQTLSAAQQNLFRAVANVVNSNICAVRSSITALNSVMDMELADGRSVIVCQYRDSPGDEAKNQGSGRFEHEAQLVRWLGDNSGIPVARIIAMSTPTVEIPIPYMIMDKLPGKTLYGALGAMTMDEKICPPI
ncbi:hypothetical protein HGRIS_011624 [Hohenbuehelia grisea]|uniref:Uncharacterized protein n=1 Tax=Hohenbuehelia grisea TaxID=104357 RepID=A0ABR3JVM9_9AGAR